MFVCHGNICRSPMAEFIFKKIAEDYGAREKFTVSSSATSSEEIWGGIGNPMYPPAKKELERQGVPYKERRAVQLKKSDYGEYDLFVGMDSANIRNMNRIFGLDSENKIHKLLDFTAQGGDVADPWYSDRFDIAYKDIYNGCLALFEKITKI